MINSHRIINPLIEGRTSDTLGRCEESLAYISETITTLQPQESTPTAYQGLQNLIECIQGALAYEAERLNQEEFSKQSREEKNEMESPKH